VAAFPDDSGQEIMDRVVGQASDDPFRLPNPEKINRRDQEEEPNYMGDLHRSQYPGSDGKADAGGMGSISG
jgi:hypothetical protein